MKLFIYSSIFLVLTISTLPSSADAFSRRTHHSELPQNQQIVSVPVNGESQSVPEPSPFVTLGIGLGLVAVFLVGKRCRGQHACGEKER